MNPVWLPPFQDGTPSTDGPPLVSETACLAAVRAPAARVRQQVSWRSRLALWLVSLVLLGWLIPAASPVLAAPTTWRSHPSVAGARTATLRSANASAVTPYRFTVEGTGEPRTGSNVALNKPATQSSTYDPNCSAAAKAVDGNTDGNYGSCSLATGNQDDSPWWQVDLQGIYQVSYIDLWNRTDCCGERLNNFDLQISTDGATWTNFGYDGVAGVTTNFAINAAARYVKVQLRDPGFIGLAEVQVWSETQLPVIDVQGNSVSIANGDTTPDGADHTNFGSAGTGTGTVVRTFTIRNTGQAALTLSGAPVTVSGTDASDFSVSAQPASNSVAAGDSTTFQVTFDPSAVGVRTATLSIANDSAVTPYTFAIGGTGAPAGNNVALNKPATQSSTYDPNWSVAAKAVDGNTDGAYGNGSLAHTNQDDAPWWQVDLQGIYQVSYIDLWNRTDDCCTQELRNFDLQISTDGATWTNFGYDGVAGVTTNFAINAAARYVKVQRREPGVIGLAEVQVWSETQLPIIAVQGNGVSIASGDTTPDAADHTDFGSVDAGTGTVVRTFTIRNTGEAALTLSGAPVTVSGTDASDFSVSAQPAGNSVAAGDSTTFQVTFDPSAVGVRTAMLSIANDSAVTPYTFAIGGTGSPPNARINGSDCNLIDAIIAANTDRATGACHAGNGEDTITLLSDVTLTAVNSDLRGDTGLPLINSVITLEGAGYTIARSTATDTPRFRLLDVANNGNLTLHQVTLTGGSIADAGGGIFNQGTLTLNNSTLTANTADAGGGIYNSGTLTLNNSTLSGNTANFAGFGGGISNYGTLTVSNSTLSGNSTGKGGGGIFNQGTLTVSNSTLSGNSANSGGGGIFNYGTVTVSNSTLSGNGADQGGGISNDGGTLTVSNSTLSDNLAGEGGGIYNAGTVNLARSLISGNSARSGAEIYNDDTINAASFNLIGYGGDARSTNFTPSGSDIVPSQVLVAILDTTLADNGGSTLTHALAPGSPARDAAGDSGLATDQRGVTRPQGAADDIGAFEMEPLPVNARINGSDCNLIEAIIAANTDTATGACHAGNGDDTITLLSDVTLTAVNNNFNDATGLPLITTVITLEGAGHTIARSTASSTPAFRLLGVASNGNLTLHQVTLTGGSTTDAGGGIYNDGTLTLNNSTLIANDANNYGGGISNQGTLTLSNSTLSANTTAEEGGGIFNNQSGTLTVSNSTLSGNTAPYGGGIFNYYGTVTVSNSTLSGNSANDGGGGISNFGTVTVSNSTLSGNTAPYGGGIYNYEGTLNLARSLISGNSAGDGAEIYNGATINAASFNLIGYGGDARSTNFTPSGSDIVPSQALVAILDTTLADNGGSTLTHALAPGSPARDAAGDSGLATDQRGVTRPQGAADDIGAFEMEPLPVNARINGSDCNLIEAIITANTDTATGACHAGSGDDTITLLSDVTLTAVNNYFNDATGLPGINSVITLEGAGHTIARSTAPNTPPFRLLDVASNGNLTLHQVTLTGGSISKGTGGGINNLGTLTLNNSTLTANTASTGGGIYNTGTLTLNNSTLTANTASTGGGIFNNRGTVTVSNSTLSGNTASNSGGGSFNNRGTVTVSNSTLTANTAFFGGGIFNSGTVNLARSLISGNNAPSEAEIYNAGATINAANFNLIGYGGNARSFNFTPSGSDIVPSQALAAILNTTLADNGGPSTGSGQATLTHALVTGSPARDAAGDSGLATDQRGITRPQGTADDIGAFELEAVPATITIVLDSQPNLPTNLGFQGSLGAFLLDDPAVDDSDAYTNTKSFSVAPGVYTVRRNNATGWFLTDITCTPTGKAALNLFERRATLTVASGDSVTCTYTVQRGARILARTFNDLVRNSSNLGRRNAADPWLNGWAMNVFSAPNALVANGWTRATSTAGLYQASFITLQPGDYTVCTVLRDGSWTPTTPNATNPDYANQPCKAVTLAPGQVATVLFGAYQSTVVASEAFTPADELVTDEDSIVDQPYDPAEDETATDEAGARRLFLPLVAR